MSATDQTHLSTDRVGTAGKSQIRLPEAVGNYARFQAIGGQAVWRMKGRILERQLVQLRKCGNWAGCTWTASGIALNAY